MALGIDIGKYSIKMVQLSKSGNDIKVDQIGSINTFKDLNSLISLKRIKHQKYG